jgi:hypothetical protein
VPFPHDIVARSNAFAPENQRWMYQNMSEVFPTRAVSRSGHVHDFNRNEDALDGFVFEFEGQKRSLTRFMDETEALGLIILRDGVLIHESYAPGCDHTTKFTTFSVVKSITSLLVGFAIQDGYIRSVDDPLTDYLEDLNGTAYEGVSIRDALKMSSGVRFDLTGWPDAEDTVDFVTSSIVTGKQRAYEKAKSYPRQAPPGTLFNYNTAESQILLELVARASGAQVADYLEQSLWHPLGMEHDALWVLDQPGPGAREVGGAFFNASLRDWAKIGLLMQQGGRWEGAQLLSREWVEASTRIDEHDPSFGNVVPRPDQGYALHWHVYKDGSFAAQGAYGQSIHVDPVSKIVIARTSVWPSDWVEAYDLQTSALLRALSQWPVQSDE